ncbi:MAG: hypothetical protein JRN51_10450, partial [Nitrososphaerota archaeon]|nr:hypothetical protein [Nitrososphaerota archaeon]
MSAPTQSGSCGRLAFALLVAGLLLLTPFQASRADQAHAAPTMALPRPVGPGSVGPAAGGLGAQPGASPGYDEQIGATFTQDFSTLAFNVTAVGQVDSNGYGPGYLLNGLTAAGYWYQVG